MATAARELVAAPSRRGKGGGKKPGQSTPAQAVASRRNGKAVEWRPECKKRESEKSSGVYVMESQEEAWERTRRTVEHYTAIGYPAEVICRLVRPSVSEGTLRKHFAYELENGRLVADAKMAGTAYQLGVTGRDPAMCRFWVRARLGWRDHGDTKTGALEVKFTPIDGDDW